MGQANILFDDILNILLTNMCAHLNGKCSGKRTENTNHTRFMCTLYTVRGTHINDWFILIFFYVVFVITASLSRSLSILHTPSPPPPFFLSRNVKNDKLFMKKVNGTKFERSFLWKRKKKQQNNGNWFDILIWVNTLKW